MTSLSDALNISFPKIILNWAYYNEFDPFAADWLRNLINAKLIMGGEVDERSITEVDPGDVRGFSRCHFFAGIGGWDYALALAGWPAGREVWTGSCPCQPFSNAGKRRKENDERHLWPEFYRLISECRPDTIFGEQVASADGRLWLAAVQADMEELDYRVGAADLCAAGIGAPHIRQRLWWVADAENVRHIRAQGAGRENGDGVERRGGVGNSKNERRGKGNQDISGIHAGSGEENRKQRSWGGRGVGGLDKPNSNGWASREQTAEGSRYGSAVVTTSTDGGMGEAIGEGPQGHSGYGDEIKEPGRINPQADGFVSETSLFDYWRDVAWWWCRDGKYRPIKPGIVPVANGVPDRVGRLRGYGNAIVPQVAREFIMTYLNVSGR